jgi:hypothetical protein
MITTGGAKLVEDARLVAAAGSAVAPVDAGEGLAFGGQTHVRGLGILVCGLRFEPRQIPLAGSFHDVFTGEHIASAQPPTTITFPLDGFMLAWRRFLLAAAGPPRNSLNHRIVLHR